MVPDKAKLLRRELFWTLHFTCLDGCLGMAGFWCLNLLVLREGPWLGEESKWEPWPDNSLFLLTLNPEGITVIALVSSLPHTGHRSLGSHCSYLECPFVPLYLYNVYFTFIVTQDESWRVTEFYGRKRTKPCSSKSQQRCPRSLN